MVILDQFIDFTRHRKNTFFDSFPPSDMKHTPMAEPFDSLIRNNIKQSMQELGITFHTKGTVITIEGPRFSTKAESNMFRQWGADVINMTTATEAALAKEIGIPYAAVALSTDYDCWKEDEEPVTWEAVMAIFQENIKKVTDLLLHAVARIVKEPV